MKSLRSLLPRIRVPYQSVVVAIVVFGFSSAEPALGQRSFPHLFTLDSRSGDTLYTPDATSERHRYRVTAWGTYSMWEDTVNSSVDPVWIYSFPEEEWAKPEWRIFPEGYPIYVGDNRMFDSHGLRVNNKPFPELALNDDHRYEMIIDGTGAPLSTSIVDWNFKNFEPRDAHDNNSGFLYVLVEELPLYELELCAVDSSSFPNVRVSMTLWRDSVRVEDLGDKIALYEDGREVMIDSIDCGERTRPVSVALVVDRSGSMTERWGGSTRMVQVRSAARGFVDRLADDDEGALYTFGNSVTLDQTWTNRKEDLRSGIDRISPGGYTAMNDAVDEAIRGVASRPDRYRKGVVLLSDGEDNISRIRSISEVVDLARSLDVPVFTIGLLLQSDDSLRALSAGTGGRHFNVTDPGSIDSVFASIAELLFEKGCCNIWYRSPRPEGDGTYRGVEGVVRIDGDSMVMQQGGYNAPRNLSSVSQTGNHVEGAKLAFVRGDDYTRIQVVGLDRDATLEIVNIRGVSMFGPIPLSESSGALRTVGIPTGRVPSGTYIAILSAGEWSLTGRFLVVR